MCRPAHVLLDLMIFFLLFYFFTSRVETPPWEEVLLGCEPATAVNANTDTPLCEMKRQTHNLINEKMMWTLVWRQRTLKNEQVNGMMAHPWCLNKSAHTPWCMVVQCYAYAMTHEHLCLVLFSKARLLKYIWIIRHRNFKCFFFLFFLPFSVPNSSFLLWCPCLGCHWSWDLILPEPSSNVWVKSNNKSVAVFQFPANLPWPFPIF